MKTSSRNFIENIISYGMIAGLLVIIARSAIYLFDIDQTNVSFAAFNFVYNLVVISVCLYFGTIAYRKKTATGNLAYGKGLLMCICISFVAVFLIYTYDIIFYVYIAPDYLANMLEPQVAAIANSPIPLIQKMELMYKLEKYKSPFYFTGMNALTSTGLSLAVSLIMAIFTVRNRPISNEQLTMDNE